MNHLKTYPAHLALYLIGALDFISTLPIAGGLAPYTGYITAAGVLAAALHHSYQTGAASAVVQAVASAPVKLVLATMALSIVLGASMLQGCATLQKVFSPASAPYVTAAVDVAVATAESKGVKAVQINAIAKQALAADTGAGASLAAVTTLVSAQIAKLNLPAADLAAVQILELALTGAVQQQIGQNPDIAVAQADVAQLLSAVIAVTGG